jgi:hypothetical protein
MTCTRMFKFQILSGREADYAAYLRGVVAVIDAAAHDDGVFETLVTITPDAPTDWNHGRIFTFRDTAQRAAFAGRMASHAAAFDGSADATAKRKAFAETLRRQVAVADYSVEAG